MSLQTLTTDCDCRVLLVEDDIRLAKLMQEYLQDNGISVAVEARGDRAVGRIVEEKPDLVILDLMLPGLDGFEVCRSVRRVYAGPIMMLTARDEEIDQVVGLELGADDYVTKPVQPRVLLARMRALLRRTAVVQGDIKLPHDTQLLEFGALTIKRAAREVQLGDRKLDFTTNEFELLWLLASHAGQVLNRDNILESLRGIGYDGLDRSVDVCISRLRKKLEDDPNKPTRIKTVRGKGYLFVAEAWGVL